MWTAFERQAEAELAGVGDASLGEWRERGESAFHLRRRLSAAEQGDLVVADIRRTPEACQRARSVAHMLRYAAPDVLADELGEPRKDTST